jgi:hypothetical protein
MSCTLFTEWLRRAALIDAEYSLTSRPAGPYTLASFCHVSDRSSTRTTRRSVTSTLRVTSPAATSLPISAVTEPVVSSRCVAISPAVTGPVSNKCIALRSVR